MGTDTGPGTGRVGGCLLVGHSARMLAQAAASLNLPGVAIDGFGDADTRAAMPWVPWHFQGSPCADLERAIGQALQMPPLLAVRARGARIALLVANGLEALDADRAATDALAAHAPAAEGGLAVAPQPGTAPGAGSSPTPSGFSSESPVDGFGRPLWAGVGQGLVMACNQGHALASCCRPDLFHALCQRLGIPVPVTRSTPPDRPDGWLYKRAGLGGGWGVMAASHGPLAQRDAGANGCWQQRLAGPVGSLNARILRDGTLRESGWTRLYPGSGGSPWRFAGMVAPVVWPAPVQRTVRHALAALAGALGLRGWVSLDFIHTETGPCILELNPRPGAGTELLEPPGQPGQWLSGQLQDFGVDRERAADASRRVAVPSERASAAVETAIPAGRCLWRVMAPAAVQWPDAAGQERLLARHPQVRLGDRPAAGSIIAAGDPVCTVLGWGEDSTGAVRRVTGAVADVLTTLRPAPVASTP